VFDMPAFESAFDRAPDAPALLEHVMWGQGSPQKESVALENLRSLNEFGIAQVRAEMRYQARERQQVGHADTYNPWDRD
jgi:hypothetical protein